MKIKASAINILLLSFFLYYKVKCYYFDILTYLKNFGELFCTNVARNILQAFEMARISPSAVFDEVWEHHIFRYILYTKFVKLTPFFCRKSNQANFLERPEITSPIKAFIESSDMPKNPLVVYGGIY